MKPPTPRVAILVTAAAAVAWGTSFPVNRVAVADVDPAAFTAVRFAAAAVLLAPILALAGRFPRDAFRRPAAWAGAAGNAAGFLLQYCGQAPSTP
ncbi:MAG: EamA family transporter, partial [Methanobacteriota archaeon]